MAGVLVTALAWWCCTVGAALHPRIDLNRATCRCWWRVHCRLLHGCAARPAEHAGAAFFTLLALIAAATSVPLIAIEALTTGLQMPSSRGCDRGLGRHLPSFLSQYSFWRRRSDRSGACRRVHQSRPVFAAVLAVTLINEPFAAYHAAALVW